MPTTIVKAIRNLEDHVPAAPNEQVQAHSGSDDAELLESEIPRRVGELREKMKLAAKALEFEVAAALRDRIVALEARFIGLAR